MSFFNPGTVDVDKATEAIVNSGGGVSTRDNYDGSTHYSVYSTTENRHLSYDKYPDGHVENVHTDKDGHAYMNYGN